MPFVDTGRLTCPACGCESTHQLGVLIHDRESEDAERTTAFVASRCGCHNDAEKANGVRARAEKMQLPCSERRDCLHVLVECEACEKLTAYTFLQHKGETETHMTTEA